MAQGLSRADHAELRITFTSVVAGRNGMKILLRQAKGSLWTTHPYETFATAKAANCCGT